MVPLAGTMDSVQRNDGFRKAEYTIWLRGARRRSTMAKAETIRGLERGLKVIEALQANPISSLHDIHLATAISKPSLLRVLHTLEQFGLVSRRLADGHYRFSTPGRRANATATIASPRRPPPCSTGCARKYPGRPICSFQPA